MSEKPDKKQIESLLAFHGHSLRGGKIVKAILYADATKEKRIQVMVDYGIKGTKKFDTSIHELDVRAGKVEPTLEMLSMEKLRAIAADLKVPMPTGRPNPVKLIVAIRAKLKADALAEVEAEIEDEAEVEKPLSEMTKAELLVEAEIVGAEVKKRWANPKIIEAIEAIAG